MALIRASCPTCGDIELSSRDITVVSPGTSPSGRYFFRCPSCQDFVNKHAEARIIDLLLSAGVGFITLPVDSIGEGTTNPLTYDDLLTFHGNLKGIENLDELLRAENKGEPEARVTPPNSQS